MNQKQDARLPNAGPFWPWFVGGCLSPIGARLLTGPLPTYLAAGLSFFIFLGTASFLVARSLGTSGHRAVRILLGSAAGAVVLAVLMYVFPPR